MSVGKNLSPMETDTSARKEIVPAWELNPDISLLS